jgi:cytochrome c-type biogenesis protein CcmH/NrfG
MRDFFIGGFEILLGIIIVLLIIGVIAFAGVAAFGGGSMMVMNGQPMPGGPAVGAAILVAGLIYVLFVGGFMYLGLGIYQNTKRTAAAMERMAGK